MKKTLSVAAKLVILMIFALALGATVVALSMRSPHAQNGEERFFGTTKHFEKKYSVEPGGLLVLSADAGDITISGGESQELSAVVSVQGSENDLARYNVNFEQDGNTIRIKGKHDHSFYNMWGRNSIEAHYEITLPKKFDLQVETSGGDIIVHTVDGHVKGETSGGDIELNDISGVVNMSTSGGNMRLENLSGELTAETSGGEIKGKMLTGTVAVESSGGSINIVDSDAKLKASTSGGDIRVELKDNKGLSLSTSGGSIIVTLPKSVSAQVDATTTGGDVSCDFPFQGKMKDGNMHGKINGGGNLIEAETSGGDISITSKE